MNKISKSQLFNFGVTVLSIVGMFLASKAHDSEMEELKEEIKSELRKEREEK